MIGFVAMVGINIKTSIPLVEFTDQPRCEDRSYELKALLAAGSWFPAESICRIPFQFPLAARPSPPRYRPPPPPRLKKSRRGFTTLL